MSLLVRSKTNNAVLLLGCKSKSSPFYFAVKNTNPPGISFEVEHSVPIEAQLRAKAEEVVGKELVEKINLFRDNVFEFSFEQKDFSLFIATVEVPEEKIESRNWLTMPELINKMPRVRARLAYLKAWQVLQGCLGQEVSAIDFATLKKNLLNSIERQ